MKYKISALLIICFITITLHAGNEKDKLYASYFTTANNIVLLYESTFGETKARYTNHGSFTFAKNESDRFKYYQKLIINDSGIYVNETYQYIKLLLFLKKESTFTYEKPLLRIPFPLSKGKTWNTSGIEFDGEDTSTVNISGKVVGYENIKTIAGNFETICIETKITGSGSSNNTVTEWYAENIGLVKAKIIISGGGLMGFARDILGYGQIDFELKEIIRE